jgi:hypothetical protein
MIVRELLTLLGFTVDQASYQKAQKAYDSLQGKLLQQQKSGQQASQQMRDQGKAAAEAARGSAMLGQALGMMQRFAAQAGLSNLLKEYVELASSADETQNVIKQLFGDQGLAEVTAWSETMGEAMGRSKYSLQQYASTLGAVIQPIAKSDEQAQAMAQSLAALSVDLGSFFNTSDEDAMRALRSGLTGEYESLKRYGVVLNDTTLQEIAASKGIKKKVTQMSAAEKTELRYEAILKRTERVEGDAIRTREGFANSSKAIKETLKDIGTDMAKTVLPKIEKLIGYLRDGMKWFRKAAKGSHLLETAMYTLAAVAGILALQFYGAFVLPAIAVAALILLIDDLWTTLSGGESVTRDLIDGMFGEGTTAKVVDWIKATFGPLMEALGKLDAQGIWQTFADGADNAAFAVQRLIEKMLSLLKYTPPGLLWMGAKAAGRATGLLGQEDAEGRATRRGIDAPIAETIGEELALRQRDQAGLIAAGVEARNKRRAERERERKYGPSQWSAVPADAGPATIPYAAGPMVSAPAAGGGGAAAEGPAPIVNVAGPTIIINGGDTDKVKRVVDERLEAQRKKTAAALGGRGRS